MTNNVEKHGNAIMWSGGTLFVTGAAITLGCIIREAYRQSTIFTQHVPYSFDIHSSTGALHLSALIIGIVGALLILIGNHLDNKLQSETKCESLIPSNHDNTQRTKAL